MSDVLLTLDEVHQLVVDALRVNGCNSENAAAVARLMAQLRLLSDSFHLVSFRPTVVVVSLRWHCNKADLLWRKQPVTMALRRWH